MMNTLFVQNQIRSIQERISDHSEALDWATLPKPIINWGEYLPKMTSQTSRDALLRYLKTLAGVGRRVYSKRSWGTIGSVSWGGDSEKLDAALTSLDIEALARQAFRRLFALGIVGLLPYRDATTGQPTLEVLSGYLENITHESNRERDLGLMQAWQSDGGRWNVRIWRYDEGSMYEWRGLASPSALGSWPTPIKNAPMPVHYVIERDQGGLPVGEIVAGLELLRGELVDQIGYRRVAEAHVFPVRWLAGPWSEIQELGPNVIVKSNDASKSALGVWEGGSLEPVTQRLDDTLARIREHFSLPFGVLGSQTPSGEALREANQSYIAACSTYAKALATLLSAAVESYAKLLGVQPAPVSIDINREATREARMAEVRENYARGLMPRRQAVIEILAYYPMWRSEDAYAWLDEVDAQPDIANILGG